MLAQERIGYDKVNGFLVSTVRLPLFTSTLDGSSGYETMIFPEGTWSDIYCERYDNDRDKAVSGHAAAIKLAEQGKEAILAARKHYYGNEN